MNEKQFQDAAGLGPELAARWFAAVNGAMVEFAITAPIALAMFIAQTGAESQGFTRLTESLNYTPEGLLQTFGKYFTPDRAQAYGRTAAHPADQKGIASIVYANRMGNHAPDDGWSYRGRGLIQLTGYDNYKMCAEALDIDILTNPDLLAQDANASRSAAWFWQYKRCNEVASDINEVTRRINGGLNGLDDRQARFERAKVALGL